MKKRVLVLGNMPQRLQDQILLCQKLKRIDSCLSFLFLLYDDRNKNLVRESGFSVESFKTISGRLKSKSSKLLSLRRFASFLYRHFYYSTFLTPFHVQKYLKEFRTEYNWINDMFSQFEPDIVMLNGDRHLGLEPSVLKVCKENGIPTFVPYLVYSSEVGPMISNQKKPWLTLSWNSPFILRWLVKRMPQSILKAKKLECIFYNPSTQIALQKFGVLSDYPWYIGNGLVDMVCMDSSHSLNRYTSNRVPDSKLRIVGDAAYDNLYLAYTNRINVRETLMNRYGGDSLKKVILCALPQVAEHNLMDWDQHWKEIHFIIDTLDQQNQNLFLSLHPKMKREDYEFLEQKYKCHILEERLYDVMPIGDIFVATFSSTVIWAAICGVKSVLVDFYDFDVNIFDFLQSVQCVKNKENFLSTVQNRLMQKQDFSADWKRLSRDLVFDGGVINRYYTLIDSLTTKPDESREMVLPNFSDSSTA